MKAVKNVKVTGRVSVVSNNRNEFTCIDEIVCDDFGFNHAWISQQSSDFLSNRRVGEIIGFTADLNPYVDKNDNVKIGFVKVRNTSCIRGVLTNKAKQEPSIFWAGSGSGTKHTPSSYIYVSVSRTKRISVCFSQEAIKDLQISDFADLGISENLLYVNVKGSSSKFSKSLKKKVCTVASTRLNIKEILIKRISFAKQDVKVESSIIGLDISELLSSK